MRIDGEVRELADNIELDKNHQHNIEVVVDRLVARDGIQERLTDSLRTALKRGDGLAIVEVAPKRTKSFLRVSNGAALSPKTSPVLSMGP